MNKEKLLDKILDTKRLIIVAYREVDASTRINDEQLMKIYEFIEEKEVYLDSLVQEYEKQTGNKFLFGDEKAFYAKDIKPSTFDSSVEFLNQNLKVLGNDSKSGRKSQLENFQKLFEEETEIGLFE